MTTNWLDAGMGAFEAEDYVPETPCHWCGQIFGPEDTGHCTGGKFGGCCQTFASNHAFDRHRTGPHNGDRRCLTTDEMTAKGWAQAGKYNAWRTPAPANSPWKDKK